MIDFLNSIPLWLAVLLVPAGWVFFWLTNGIVVRKSAPRIAIDQDGGSLHLNNADISGQDTGIKVRDGKSSLRNVKIK